MCNRDFVFVHCRLELCVRVQSQDHATGYVLLIHSCLMYILCSSSPERTLTMPIEVLQCTPTIRQAMLNAPSCTPLVCMKESCFIKSFHVGHAVETVKNRVPATSTVNNANHEPYDPFNIISSHLKSAIACLRLTCSAFVITPSTSARA